jgi:AcrR family transcriptional regulator
MDSQSQPKRKYELKRRADEMARTRRRIAEATVELHGTIGPARTTLSAVAERAGVQRHTVYRHFPTEADLFGACSGLWVAANPLPDHEMWRRISDPRRRLATALNELYAYYERTEPMLTNVLRDADLVEALRPTVAPMQAFLAETAQMLTAGWGARGHRRRVLETTIAHGIDFHTWRSLTASGELSRTEAVDLVTALVEAAATRRRRAAA